MYETPGHAPSHVCLHQPERRLLISGDHLLGRTVIFFDYGDFTIVDLKAKRTITNAMMKTKSGWTPFDGMELPGRVVATAGAVPAARPVIRQGGRPRVARRS